MKKLLTLALLGITALTFTGCGISVPEDKQEYIGQWNSESATLNVYPQRIEYETHGTMSSSISAPITKFEDEDFFAGIWKSFRLIKAISGQFLNSLVASTWKYPMPTRFIVSLVRRGNVPRRARPYSPCPPM